MRIERHQPSCPDLPRDLHVYNLTSLVTSLCGKALGWQGVGLASHWAGKGLEWAGMVGSLVFAAVRCAVGWLKGRTWLWLTYVARHRAGLRAGPRRSASPPRASRDPKTP